MSTFINGDLTFTDNSTGDRAEDGTEVQIYSDSPSFVPNIPTDHAYAPHPWMSLPLVGAGVSTIPIRLEAPVSLLKVRVRQFNVNGNGNWNLPGGGAGEVFILSPATSANAPNAPSNVGFAVTAGGTPVPPGPVTPPPVPEPPSSSSNYTWPAQFAGVQGSSGWSYKDSSGADLTYDAATSLWKQPSQAYLTVWSGGLHPGPSLGTLVRWTVPQTGAVVITGSTGLYSSPGGGKGLTMTIKHNATTEYTQSMTDTTTYTLSESFAVTAGDTIDFLHVANQADNSNESTSLSINIALTSGGSPTNPTAASIAPATLSANTGTVTSVSVGLSNSALENSVVTLTSSNTATATVPASITIPIGQSSGLFDITALAAGTTTITATYNSGSAQCAVTVVVPTPGGQWPNQPAGMTLVTDTPFSDSLPSEWFNVYNTQSYASPGGAGTAFSAPRAFDEFMSAGSNTGNGQWGINIPYSSEIYMGMYWSTNADFIGYSNTTNKMIFFRDSNLDNSFLNWHGAPGAAKQIKWYFQSPYSNAHLAGWDGDPSGVSGRLPCNVNGAAATMAAGSGWHFIELYLKKSTTTTSQNGTVKWWVDGTLCGNYTNCNICPNGFNEMQLTAAWDGSPSGRDLTKSWHHYFDHLYISRKA